MCLYVGLYVCVCVYLCVFVMCVCVPLGVCLRVFACEYVCVRVRACISLWLYARHMRACMPVHAFMSEYVCFERVFFHVLMGVRACIKIEAYIHIIPMVPKFSGLMLFRSRILT